MYDSTGTLQIAGPLTKVGTLTTSATGQATMSFPVVTVTIPGASTAPTAIAVSLVPSGAAASPSFYVNAGLGGGTANIAIAITPVPCG